MFHQNQLRSAQARVQRKQDRVARAEANKRDRKTEEFLARQVPGDATPDNNDDQWE